MKYAPEREITYIVVTAPDATKDFLCIWTEPEENIVGMIYKMVRYSVKVEDILAELDVVIENDAIVDVNTESVKVTGNFEDWLSKNHGK